VLDWWDFSSSMVSITDLFPPNEEVIWGKSNFNCDSESGFDSYLAKRTLMSWWGSWELNNQWFLCKIVAFLMNGMYAIFVIIYVWTKYIDVNYFKKQNEDHECEVNTVK
jgi:hypothetical protein